MLVVDDEDELEVGDGPVDTTSVTFEPLGACVPAAGVVLMTELAGTVADACVVVETLKPA